MQVDEYWTTALFLVEKRLDPMEVFKANFSAPVDKIKNPPEVKSR